ncbi:MAG TPA: tRNA preQ1(34) S-adenosylmethionine ribosyltransferase-isomerase QueA [Candidatus Sulfotelmatobacter sp.]|nr:tRNA preQ1(34) S-adenosylmethionine ribosyltransferase-isomerase QueA [Candidatus Sulfotelmatobacter sp.]
MLVSDFHYELPQDLIAQQPLRDRAASRLLHLAKSSGNFEDLAFRDFPNLLRPGDLVVFNNTKVFPARLYARRKGVNALPLSPRNPASREFLRGRVEILLTRQSLQDGNEWECLVRPGRKIGVGEHLFFGENDELQAEVIARGGFGERRIRFAPGGDFFGILEKIGHVPLPPYIARTDSPADRDRYQTVYARQRGSVAAPTAGLHFTPEILSEIAERGIEKADITLHVGLGTFQPIRTEKVEEHHLHSESFSISSDAAEKIENARAQRRRVIAIGTTTVRTLEFVAQQNAGAIRPAAGEANLFIYPGFNFQVVGALLTNFHLPQSTLLMLVCALGGKENVIRAYKHAVAERYRFYSYGDCMFVE